MSTCHARPAVGRSAGQRLAVVVERHLRRVLLALILHRGRRVSCTHTSSGAPARRGCRSAGGSVLLQQAKRVGGGVRRVDPHRRQGRFSALRVTAAAWLNSSAPRSGRCRPAAAGRAVDVGGQPALWPLAVASNTGQVVAAVGSKAGRAVETVQVVTVPLLSGVGSHRALLTVTVAPFWRAGPTRCAQMALSGGRGAVCRAQP